MQNIILYILLALDNTLVAGLGAEDFSVREVCAKVLVTRGWQARAALEGGITSHDTEISHTSRLLYTSALENEIDLLRGLDGTLPEIDAAWFNTETYTYQPCGFGTRYNHMVSYLVIVGRDGYPYNNYRLATYLWVRAELESGVTAHSLQPLVTEMRIRDEVFLRRYKLQQTGQRAP